MKQTINLSMFRDAFKNYNRENNFSYIGLNRLFEHFEQLEDDLGEQVELDVIAICCDFSEISVSEIERETGCKNLDELRDSTTVIEVDDETIIYGSF